ncbi:MAG TPA: hypothetical protein VN888_26500, partial [Mycobacterium sp.]|nr:hypothetical protein [Mycobacterium sp.]
MSTWGLGSGADGEQRVGLLYPGLLFVVPGRHGDQVIGRRRPSRRLLPECYGRAACSRSEAQWSP